MFNVTPLPPGPAGELSFGDVTLVFVKIVPGDEPRGFVPSYHFRILTRNMTDAGHIGYEIHEPFRGHSYALQACCALAPFVRSVYSAVIITADPDNPASIRTIERLGAVFMDEVPVAPHEPQYKQGSRMKRRYRWAP